MACLVWSDTTCVFHTGRAPARNAPSQQATQNATGREPRSSHSKNVLVHSGSAIIVDTHFWFDQAHNPLYLCSQCHTSALVFGGAAKAKMVACNTHKAVPSCLGLREDVGVGSKFKSLAVTIQLTFYFTFCILLFTSKHTETSK